MKYLAQLGELGIAPDFVKIFAHNKNFISPERGNLFPLIDCFLYQQLDDRHVKF